MKVAVPNLFYGKTLIELAQQGENKLLVLPEEEEEDVEGDAEECGDNADSDTDDDENSSEVPNLVANGSGSGQKSMPSASSNEPQPGTSSGIQKTNGNGNANNDEEETNENLQYAWEALEMAARIFQRLGKGYEEYLAEAHYGLGEILMENQNCPEAIRDYSMFRYQI